MKPKWPKIKIRIRRKSGEIEEVTKTTMAEKLNNSKDPQKIKEIDVGKLLDSFKPKLRNRWKIEGWVIKLLKIGDTTFPLITIKKMKRIDEFLSERWFPKNSYTITTAPIIVYYNWLGFPMSKEVFFIDPENAVTMKIDKGETEKDSKTTTWVLKPYLLNAVLNSGLFTQIWRQFKINTGATILTFIIGATLGFLIGGMFL